METRIVVIAKPDDPNYVPPVGALRLPDEDGNQAYLIDAGLVIIDLMSRVDWLETYAVVKPQ